MPRPLPNPLTPTTMRAFRYPFTLIALFIPGVLFATGLFLVQSHPRYAWLAAFPAYPWEFWVILVCGLVATLAGVADWVYHRSGRTAIGSREHHCELMALVCGGVPLFGLMAASSVISRPTALLLPVLVVVLFTAAMICYDEYVFHRKRCGWYEMILHRLLVFGNGIAWLAWANWCFVRGGTYG